MKFSDSAPLRLVLGLLLGYLLGATLLFFFLDYQLTATLTREVDRGLYEERDMLQNQYRDHGTTGLHHAIELEIESEGSHSHGFRVLDQAHHITYQAGGLALPMVTPFEGVRQLKLEASDGQLQMVRVISFPIGRDMNGFVASSIEPTRKLIGNFRQTFLITAGVVSLFGLVLGYWLAWRFRRRIDSVNRHAQLIVQSGDLSSRMPVAGNDEFSALAGNMNAMLDRIEKLVQGIRQVSDNIAHDLRTPLTRLRADVQMALQQENAEAHHAALERVHEELEKMQSIFSSILAISRAESGGMPVKRAVVDFSGLLDEMFEFYAPPAEERGLTLRGEIADDLQVYGNRQLLAQILSNLLDNALKYVPPGGIVSVSARRAGKQIRVVVEDSGPGIPIEMRNKVFERFTRLDPSRTMAGSGLGLSLAKAFVELHHGKIAVSQSELGGSAFVVDFPMA